MELCKKEQEEIHAHFPDKVSKEIMDYVNDEVLLGSRYIFTQRSGSGQQYGYCTHCKKTFRTDNHKHNERVRCTECESECVAKSSGRGRGKMYDEAYFVWYEKSLTSPNAITARGIHVIRDYRECYRSAETKFRVTAMYVFEPGKSVMIDQEWKGNWRKRRSIYSESTGVMRYKNCYYSRKSISKAVEGTLFQYCTWEQYHFDDMLNFFDLAAKYPCVEYLTKLGLSNFVKEKIYGNNMYRVINWNGKTLNKVLRLNKQDIKTLRDLMSINRGINPFTLYLYQQSKKDELNISFIEFMNLVKCVPIITMKRLKY